MDTREERPRTFVEAVLAPEYLATDKPVLRVRSYGTALAAVATIVRADGSELAIHAMKMRPKYRRLLPGG